MVLQTFAPIQYFVAFRQPNIFSTRFIIIALFFIFFFASLCCLILLYPIRGHFHVNVHCTVYIQVIKCVPVYVCLMISLKCFRIYFSAQNVVYRKSIVLFQQKKIFLIVNIYLVGCFTLDTPVSLCMMQKSTTEKLKSGHLTRKLIWDHRNSMMVMVFTIFSK